VCSSYRRIWRQVPVGKLTLNWAKFLCFDLGVPLTGRNPGNSLERIARTDGQAQAIRHGPNTSMSGNPPGNYPIIDVPRPFFQRRLGPRRFIRLCRRRTAVRLAARLTIFSRSARNAKASSIHSARSFFSFAFSSSTRSAASHRIRPSLRTRLSSCSASLPTSHASGTAQRLSHRLPARATPR
jgi:hypothetical protein